MDFFLYPRVTIDTISVHVIACVISALTYSIWKTNRIFKFTINVFLQKSPMMFLVFQQTVHFSSESIVHTNISNSCSSCLSILVEYCSLSLDLQVFSPQYYYNPHEHQIHREDWRRIRRMVVCLRRWYVTVYSVSNRMHWQQHHIVEAFVLSAYMDIYNQTYECTSIFTR